MSGWWLAASAAAPILLTSARPVRKSPVRNRALMRPRICRQSARLASRTCVADNFSRGSVMLFAPSGVRGVALRHKVVAAQDERPPTRPRSARWRIGKGDQRSPARGGMTHPDRGTGHTEALRCERRCAVMTNPEQPVDPSKLRKFDRNLLATGNQLASRVLEPVPLCWFCEAETGTRSKEHIFPCLLYTSDAADE